MENILIKWICNKNQFGWSGIQNEKKMPQTDYWYTLITDRVIDGKQTIKKRSFQLDLDKKFSIMRGFLSKN